MICPYCRADIASDDALACRHCGTAVHGECAALHGRCVTFGCGGETFDTAVVPGDERRRLEPAMPASVAVRRWTRAALDVALAPTGDAALAIVGAAGVVAAALGLAAV